MGEIEQAYNRMIINGTISSSDIADDIFGSGGAPGWGSANGATDFCTTGAKCMFSPEGGGLPVPLLPKEVFVANGHYYPDQFTNYGGTTGFRGITVYSTIPMGVEGTDIGTGATDMTVIALNLTDSVCEEINTGLGISGIPDGDWMNLPNDHSGCFHHSECCNYYVTVLQKN